MLEHDAHGTLAAAEAGVEREDQEHVREGDHIVEDDGPGVAGDEVGAVGGDEGGEEAEEADGGVVADDLDDLHEDAVELLQQLRGLGLRPAAKLHAEAEEDARNDELQDGTAAPEIGEVGLGEEADDHLSGAHRLGGARLKGGLAGVDGDEADQNIHDHRGNDGGAYKGDNRSAHQLAGAFHALHVGNGGGDGDEHHRHHHAEHHVDEQRAERLENTGVGPDKTDDNAQHNANDHGAEEPVVLQEIVGLHGMTPFGFKCHCYYIPEICKVNCKFCLKPCKNCCIL